MPNKRERERPLNPPGPLPRRRQGKTRARQGSKARFPATFFLASRIRYMCIYGRAVRYTYFVGDDRSFWRGAMISALLSDAYDIARRFKSVADVNCRNIHGETDIAPIFPLHSVCRRR